LKGSFHIGDWEVQPRINCVQKGDKSFHLEPKIMQVLVQLATHSNEVLSKDQLISTVWADTFVGDDVLTRSISEIRRVLEDDARAPRFIQTIPKTGYRLMVPAAFDDNGHNGGGVVAPSAPTDAGPAQHPVPPLPTVSNPPGLRRLVWAVVSILLIIAGAFGYQAWTSRAKPTQSRPDAFKTIPLTSYLGTEMQPSFSPDGNQVAFVWKDENSDHQHVYVKYLGSESPLRITSDAADDYSPVWSPDGRSIAFLRVSDQDRGIYIAPSLGGAAHKVFNPVGTIEWERGALSWSPDGKRLIFPDGKSAKSASYIYSLRLDTLLAQRLTNPPELSDGDYSPAFSPDGSKIAFVRGTEGAVRDIFIADANGGSPRQLTFDRRYVSGLAWTADSSALVFSSDRGGKFSLWRIAVTGGEPERLSIGGEDAFSPTISRQGNHLAYTQRSAKWSIVRVSLKNPQTKDSITRVLSSTQQDSFAHFSPDSSRIAFQSVRSGTQEIWLASINGTNLVKLTSFEGPLTGSPTWSPDGRQLAFDSRPKGQSHIYVTNIEGGVPHALTDGAYNDILPSWSRDGHWVYFGSNRTGSWQIWKAPAAGGEAQQVTRQGGFIGTESMDGAYLYYVKADSPGVFRIPVQGGDEVQILKQPAVSDWSNWGLNKDGIYFLNSSVRPFSVDFYDFATKKISHLKNLDRIKTEISSLTPSPDGKWLLYTDLGEAGSRITLVENFH
jgi:Tol biopolymer transport system component/DNA-binding winged helix-turn-helix (wHTH) protein